MRLTSKLMVAEYGTVAKFSALILALQIGKHLFQTKNTSCMYIYIYLYLQYTEYTVFTCKMKDVSTSPIKPFITSLRCMVPVWCSRSATSRWFPRSLVLIDHHMSLPHVIFTYTLLEMQQNPIYLPTFRSFLR